jgi:hypothetical protein
MQRSAISMVFAPVLFGDGSFDPEKAPVWSTRPKEAKTVVTLPRKPFFPVVERTSPLAPQSSKNVLGAPHLNTAW